MGGERGIKKRMKTKKETESEGENLAPCLG